MDNSIVANITDSTYQQGTYGFWGNNCESGGLMYIKDIKIATVKQNVKQLTEVLREPEWRDNSIRVLVNVSDEANDELAATSQLGELITRLVNENINFAAWGKNTNQSQFQNLINNNNGNGIFINNTNYTTSINQTASYVKSLIDAIEQKDDYIILGDLNYTNILIKSLEEIYFCDVDNCKILSYNIDCLPYLTIEYLQFVGFDIGKISIDENLDNLSLYLLFLYILFNKQNFLTIKQHEIEKKLERFGLLNQRETIKTLKKGNIIIPYFEEML